ELSCVERDLGIDCQRLDACSAETVSDPSTHRCIEPQPPPLHEVGELVDGGCADPDPMGSFDRSRRGPRKPVRRREPPQPSVRVENDHCSRTGSQSSNSGSISSSSETKNSTLPRRLRGGSTGTMRATGFPRFVTTSSWPFFATSSRSARQRALYSLAAIVRF